MNLFKEMSGQKFKRGLGENNFCPQAVDSPVRRMRRGSGRHLKFRFLDLRIRFGKMIKGLKGGLVRSIVLSGSLRMPKCCLLVCRQADGQPALWEFFASGKIAN